MFKILIQKQILSFGVSFLKINQLALKNSQETCWRSHRKSGNSPDTDRRREDSGEPPTSRCPHFAAQNKTTHQSLNTRKLTNNKAKHHNPANQKQFRQYITFPENSNKIISRYTYMDLLIHTSKTQKQWSQLKIRWPINFPANTKHLHKPKVFT